MRDSRKTTCSPSVICRMGEQGYQLYWVMSTRGWHRVVGQPRQELSHTNCGTTLSHRTADRQHCHHARRIAARGDLSDVARGQDGYCRIYSSGVGQTVDKCRPLR